MSGLKGNGLVPSLPPPQPKSPPRYPDLYGKRKDSAKVQMLEREIGFLEVSLMMLTYFTYKNFLRFHVI